MEHKIRMHILAENITIGLILVWAAAALLFSFIPVLGLTGAVYSALEMSRMVQRVFSVVLLITSVNLMKRRRAAWLITVVLIACNLCLHLIHHNQLKNIFIVCEAVCLAVLLLTARDFCCPTGKKTVKKAMLMGLFTAAGVFINAGIGYHSLRLATAKHFAPVVFWESFKQAIQVMFGSGDGWNTPIYRGVRFEEFIFWMSWACVLAAVVYILKPFIVDPVHSQRDLEHARRLVKAYGQNPAAYLTLEDDKLLYFGKTVDGVLPYGVVGETIVVNGDPICRDEDFPKFLEEFRDFCQKSSHYAIFLSVTGKYLEEYKEQGFGFVKCGEEARFNLEEYDIKGKKGAKMRMNINHATKAGLTVHEYRVMEQRDEVLEREFDRVSDEWLKEKKTGMLKFTVGGVGLDQPMDKRYFYAVDEAGKMCGFIVFCPFESMKGYMADVTRHASNAPGGVTEKIMYEAFQTFKEEGVLYASLGLAPLANLVQEGETAKGMTRLLDFVYNNLNRCYGFKDLFRAKEKYSPNEWLPGYYVYLPKVPRPQMLYAIVRIQNPLGVLDYMKAILGGSQFRFRSAAREAGESEKKTQEKTADRNEVGKQEKTADRDEAGKQEV